MKTRTLPHNLDAEASVLGGILLKNAALALLSELETEDFYDHRHKVVFQAMRNLEAAKKPIDVVMLEVEIERAGKLEAIGGVGFLGELALRVPTVDNVVQYAEIVVNKSRIRQLAIECAGLAEVAYEQDLECDEYFGEAMAKIAKLDRAKPDEAKPIGDYVQRRVTEIEEIVRAREAGQPTLTGIPTGIASLDEMIGGLPPGDLTILAGRPAMGKTAMAMAAIDAATAAGFGAHVFAKEGGWRMQADRAISRASRIPVSRLRAGELGAGDVQGITTAMLKYHHRKNWLLDARAGLSVTDVIRCVRRHKDELKTKLVVIDYVQLLKWPKHFAGDENQALAWIITELAQAAIADDIAYLVLSQLNRKVEERNDKRPQMADLRGSGALEERPRMILAPYRGSYYNPEPKAGTDFDCRCHTSMGRGDCRCAPSVEDFAKQVQVLILKNNNGAAGRVFANWNGATAEMW